MNNLIKISTVENKTKEPIIVNVNQRSENSKQLGKSCVLGEGKGSGSWLLGYEWVNCVGNMSKPDWSRQGQAKEFGIWFIDFGLRMTQGYQLDHSLSQRIF